MSYLKWLHNKLIREWLKGYASCAELCGTCYDNKRQSNTYPHVLCGHPDMMSPSHLRSRLYWHGARAYYGNSTQLIEDTCTYDDLQHKVPVLPCITNLWNNKENAYRHINERCRMQGTPLSPLVSRSRFGVIDRRANFILDALDASSFLFPIGQRRTRGSCGWYCIYQCAAIFLFFW